MVDIAPPVASPDEVHGAVLVGHLRQGDPCRDVLANRVKAPVVEVLVHRQHLRAVGFLGQQFARPDHEIRAEDRLDDVEDRRVAGNAVGRRADDLHSVAQVLGEGAGQVGVVAPASFKGLEGGP